MTESIALAFALREAFTLVSLAGTLNERFTVPSIVGDDPRLPFVIDTANIARINSLGVRTWIQWLSLLAKDARRVYFVRCSPPIVMQANYVANFLGGGCVLSYYAPYWCEACRTAERVLARTTDRRDALWSNRPTRPCPACHAPLQLAEAEDECFNIARDQDPVEPPVFALALEQALAELATRPEGKGASGGPEQF